MKIGKQVKYSVVNLLWSTVTSSISHSLWGLAWDSVRVPVVDSVIEPVSNSLWGSVKFKRN